jgi:HlyD family secretion protein
MIRRYGFPVLALVGFGFALWMVIQDNKTVAPAEPLALPAPAPFKSYIAGAGIVEASSQNIGIGTHLSGIVRTVFVAVGSRVKAGDSLFALDERNLRAELQVRRMAVQAARARVAEATASLGDVTNQLKIAESVTDKRAISIEELTKRRYAVKLAEAKLVSARAEVASTEAQLNATEVELGRLVVRAPVEGEILQVNVRPGEFAQTGALQMPLLYLGNLDRLHVRVDIDENDVWRFRKEGPAMAFVRGNQALKTNLRFERVEPFVVPKKSLTGGTTERVDTRVMQVLYSFDRASLPVFVGQQMDVFIEAAPVTPSSQSSSVDATAAK